MNLTRTSVKCSGGKKPTAAGKVASIVKVGRPEKNTSANQKVMPSNLKD